MTRRHDPKTSTFNTPFSLTKTPASSSASRMAPVKLFFHVKLYHPKTIQVIKGKETKDRRKEAHVQAT
eukprot:1148441-Pelagomonas_calceolata.AAC.2